jgi:predicted amidohydrolase YtcJ
MRIEACYDSHVHWAATGEFNGRLRLDHLRAPSDVAALTTEHAHFRGDWLLGFGWDDNKWTERPHRKFLDDKFPGVPVAFSRCDGHALWVNSEALKRAGLWTQGGPAETAGGRVERDADGWPTGILVERATDVVHKLIPAPAAFEIRRQLLKGVQIFNEAGFTHIRDMTCNESQWVEALKLDESGLLTLAVEEYFWLKRIDDLESTLTLALTAHAAQSENLRVKGLKIFLDGALGSESAWLSRCYHGSDKSGLVLWEKAAVREVLTRCWQSRLEPALHAIGDQAVAWLIDLALELKGQGHHGPLHIEHAELIRPETIAKMKELTVVCHMQPAHWLSDQHWLKNKIGDLAEFAFPWRRLQEADIAFDFGSDSPIEPASLSRTFQALRESAEAGVPRLLGLPTSHMSHHDLAWVPNSFTLLEGEHPRQVVFRGEHIL